MNKTYIPPFTTILEIAVDTTIISGSGDGKLIGGGDAGDFTGDANIRHTSSLEDQTENTTSTKVGMWNKSGLW